MSKRRLQFNQSMVVLIRIIVLGVVLPHPGLVPMRAAVAIGVVLLSFIVIAGLAAERIGKKSKLYNCVHVHLSNLGLIREVAIWCNDYDPLWVNTPAKIPDSVQKRIDGSHWATGK